MKKLMIRFLCLGVLCVGLAVTASTDVSASKQCGIVCVTYYTRCVARFNVDTARCEPTTTCNTDQFCEDPTLFVLIPPQP